MYYCVLFAAGAIVLVTVKITNNAGRPGDSMAEQAGEAAARDEFAFVKDRRRNRLLHGRSNILVGLFHNLRLLKNMRRLLYTEQCVGWNEDDDKAGARTASFAHRM